MDPGSIASYRTPVFSPTRTCLSVSSFAAQQLNKSTELLATLPKVSAGLQRHSSLRYKNRTLPPLPNTRPFEWSNTLPKSLAKSQPHLDEVNDEVDGRSSSPVKIRRKLSTSMDCLQSNSTINDHDGLCDPTFDLEPSPYLRPIDVQAALSNSGREKTPPIQMTASVREKPQTRPYPSLPDGFFTLQRNKRSYRGRGYSGSNPRLSEPPSKIE